MQHNAAWEAFATPGAELDGGDIADINPRTFHAFWDAEYKKLSPKEERQYMVSSQVCFKAPILVNLVLEEGNPQLSGRGQCITAATG